MKEIESIFLLATDSDQNNNKYWRAILSEDNGSYNVYTEWGRVGADKPQKKPYSFNSLFEAQSFLQGKIKDKKQDKDGKRYKEREILESKISVSSATTQNIPLEQIAYNQISFDQSNKTIKDLIDKLVKANIHQLTTFDYDIKINNSGMISTAVGIVSRKEIAEAKTILDTMMEIWSRNKETLWKTREVIKLYLNLGLNLSVRNLWVPHFLGT